MSMINIMTMIMILIIVIMVIIRMTEVEWMSRLIRTPELRQAPRL